jgi:hypothetical protein
VWVVSFVALCAMTAAVALSIDWMSMMEPAVAWVKALQGA